MLVEQQFKNGRTYIHIFGRDENSKKYHKVINDFKPYFFVLDSEEVKANLLITSIEEGDFKSLYGDKLKRIYVKNPADVPIVRKNFSKTFESDIPFENRYIIDCINKIPDEKLRIAFFDIENNDSLDTEKATEPITILTVFDNFFSKFFVFVNGTNKNYITKLDEEVYYFQEEKAMLESFIRFIQKTNPDIICGWFSNDFDIPYIINRMRRLKIDSSRLSPIHEIKDYNIKGRICFDLMKGYKKLHGGEMESYALNNVAKEELKIGKIKFLGTPGTLWKENLNKLIEYNVHDVRLLVELNKKLEIINYFHSVQKMAGCNLIDVAYASNVFDSFLLNYCNNQKEKIILPAKPKGYFIHEKVKGGIVREAVIGLHDDVGVVDLNALYPTIMISLNLSPECVDPKGEVWVGNGVRLKKEQGLIPTALKFLINFRKEIKKKMEEVMKTNGIESIEYKSLYQKQFALKIQINAFYGQMLYPRSRLYNIEIGRSVTFVGRQIITFTIDWLEKKGYKVIAGDTDSGFFLIKNKTIEKVKKDIEELNASYDIFIKQFKLEESTFKINFEKVYKRLLMIPKATGETAKKRYAGWLIMKDGLPVDTIEIKGFDSVRTDNSRFTRKAQSKILGMILRGASKEEIKECLNEIIEKMKRGEYSLDYIGIPSAINKGLNEYQTDRPILRAAKYAKKFLGKNYNKGSKPKLVWISEVKNKLPYTDVLAFDNEHEIPKGFVIDYKAMLEKGLYKKIERILNPVGWNLQEMIGKNRTLQDFKETGDKNVVEQKSD